MINEILIYNDYGSSEFCVEQLFKCFKLIYTNKELTIKKINAKQIIEDDILADREQTKLLCLGGGFDLGYMKSLTEIGMAKIKRFVESGGNYLGICAGAYFACNYVEFDLNGKLEVIGERYLKFFNGKSIGPLNKHFIYNSDDEALAIGIKINDNLNYVFLNGGCQFVPYDDDDSNENYKIIAHYCDLDKQDQTKLHDSLSLIKNEKIAIVETKNKNGKCLLSGVHFEINSFDLDKNNENVKLNLIDRLKSINDNNYEHSNYDLVKHLFKNSFNLD